MNKGTGAGLLLVSIVALMALSKKKPAGASAASITIDIVGATHNSPTTVTEGETYPVRIGITNRTMKGDLPWEADFDVAVSSTTNIHTLIPSSSAKYHFFINESKVLNTSMNVPLGSGGETGRIVVLVYDPAGNIIAQKSEVINVQTVTITYAAAVTAITPGVSATELGKAVSEGTIPAGFTATSQQLDDLIAQGITPDTEVYIAARDITYAQVAAETTSNQVIAWSSAEGYHSVEIGSVEYSSYWDEF